MSHDLHSSRRKSIRRATYIREREVKDKVLAPGLVAKWNSKEKVKTAAAALVMCLNIGVDPPGHVRISPCPIQQCWVDPFSTQISRALEIIGKNLQTQYERLQPRARYMKALDPTKEQVRKICSSLRRSAQGERVLFHYNGHGVPKPTANGEIWVFDSQYTQYIPLSVYDLQCWIGDPVMYILDCPSAGTILESVKSFMEQADKEKGVSPTMYPFSAPVGDPMKGTILMAACRENEVLDTDPNLPADLFTSCLTTPIKVALRWLLTRSFFGNQKLSFDVVDAIPGLPQDRKSPLGELNWIFTAVTDTIAWDVLPSDLFQKLFRQDLLVASLFRNFLLAERVMLSMGVMPVSYPRLPPTYNHPMWQTWDLAAKSIIMQLPGLHINKPLLEFKSSSFFSDQLDSFALSLKLRSCSKASSRQLPILLQVLLSPVHRVRAMELLCEFMEMGTWAVELALSVGVFPYVLKLLQTTAVNLQPTLISIWTKLIALDSRCQTDLCKDNGHQYFIRYLDGEGKDPVLRMKSAAVLALLCHNNSHAQMLCMKADVLPILAKILEEEMPKIPEKYELWKWLCLAIGKLIDGRVEGISSAAGLDLQTVLLDLLSVDDPELQAAALYALGSLLLPGHSINELHSFDSSLMELLASTCARFTYHACPLVRGEVAALLTMMTQKQGHSGAFEINILQLQKDAEVQAASLQRYLMAVPSAALKPYNEIGGSCAASSGDTFYDSDVFRWTTEDASLLHHAPESLLHFEGVPCDLPHDGNPSMEMHRTIVKSLCVLALDTVPQVASVAQAAFQALDWEFEFLSLKRIKLKTPATVTSVQGSLLGTVNVLNRLKSRSRPSHDSTGEGSGMSSSSTTSEFPDYQEQTRIFQIRIELATKHAQRRPFCLKKCTKLYGRDGAKNSHRAPQTSQNDPASQGTARSLLHDVCSAGDSIHHIGMLSESWIFHFCRKALALPHRSVQSFAQMAPSTSRTMSMSSDSDSKENTRTEFPKGHQLNEVVTHIKTQAENIGAVLMDAQRDLVAVSDREGKIFIHDYNQPHHPEISTFSLTESSKAAQQTASLDVVDTVALFSLESSLSLNVLLACSADGSVSVWENCLEKEDCRLRTGWQAIPVTAPPNYVLTPACYDWQPQSGVLFSAGLSAPGVIHQLDVEYETLVQKFSVDKNAHHSTDFLRSYHQNPSLLAVASDDGMIRVFDIRTEHFVGGIRPFPTQGGPISGVCPLTQEKLSVMSYGGLMKMLDIRQTNTSVVSSLVASAPIKAHSIGCTSALIAHFSKPVIASATLHPVVKIWSLDGEQICSIRPSKSGKENCQQAITCMNFHPHKASFVAAGKGPVCGIYTFIKKSN